MRKDVEFADGEKGRNNLSVPQGALQTKYKAVRQQTEKPCRRSAKRRLGVQAS